MEPKPKDIPKWKLREQNIYREKWFCVSGWLFTMPFSHPITIQPWVYWPEVLFQWVDRAWNQTGITLLSRSGFTRFTYNSLMIVLDHQLILCSQEGWGCTLSTLCLIQTPTALQWWKSWLQPSIWNKCSVLVFVGADSLIVKVIYYMPTINAPNNERDSEIIFQRQKNNSLNCVQGSTMNAL